MGKIGQVGCPHRTRTCLGMGCKDRIRIMLWDLEEEILSLIIKILSSSNRINSFKAKELTKLK